MEKGVERIDYVVHRNSKSGAAEAGVNCPPDFAIICSNENKSKNNYYSLPSRLGWANNDLRHF